MFEIKDLFEKGFHYGHRKLRSNPKMNEFVFCEKWGISIIDLCKTNVMFGKALEALATCVKKGGKVLFGGTKHQASDSIAQAATSCNQYYINKRWLGGTITNNHSTINLPLNKLGKMEKEEESGYVDKLTKRERLDFQKKKEKLLGLFSGIRTMGGVPNMLIVIDPKRENIAVKEAKLWNIPVIALADTDTPEPAIINYLVPGNDEGKGSIEFFLEKCCEVINQAAKEVVKEAPEHFKKSEKHSEKGAEKPEKQVEETEAKPETVEIKE